MIVGLARRYGWTIDTILDMPLDQVLAADYDPESRGGPSPEPEARRWAVRFATPADIDRAWAERQASRRLNDG